jgi:4-hydroxybenzoate polyprenyltransferase
MESQRKETMKLLKQLLLVSRPISWPNTAFPFAASYLVTQQFDLRLVVGTLFFLIPYNLVMYGVNDVFDYESDIRNPRKGGLEGALAAKRLHKPILIAAAVTSLPFLVWLLAVGTLVANIVLLAVMFLVLAYSVPVLRFKERPFIDSATSSAHFVGPLVYALALAGFPVGAWPLVVAFFLWGMASHAFGAVQDVLADRAGGIASIATVLGAAQTVRLALGAYTAASLLMLWYGLPAALYGLVGLAYAINIWPYRSVSDTKAETANRAWRRFIYLNLGAGFLATLLLIYLYA